MAARKEIRDFVLQNRAIQAPKWQDVEIYALRILEAYNERKADDKTVKNDVFGLVSSCKLFERMAERMGWQYHTQNYKLAIMLLISASADYDIYLSEEDIKRYKNVRMFMIEDLAQYLTNEYKRQQQQGTPPPCAPPEKAVSWEKLEASDNDEDKIIKELFTLTGFKKFVGYSYDENGHIKGTKEVVDNFYCYIINKKKIHDERLGKTVVRFLIRWDMAFVPRTIEEHIMKNNKRI
jgi:hypothetical protein